MVTSSVLSIDKKNSVLGKAFFKLGKELNLNQKQLAAILCTTELTITKLSVQLKIDSSSKQGERAVLFINLFRNLYDLGGGDLDWINHFLKSKNRLTGGIPIKQIETSDGLVSVLQLVEAIRS